MKLGYTEFSFGYAFTENLIRSSVTAPHGAPIFPNLSQEGHLGFDVHIDLPGLPLFFQYKLPELMVRSNAKELSYAGCALDLPYFRMPLMRRDVSDQHQLLIDLEYDYPNGVFYATPCLSDQPQFNNAYNAATVHERSAFISPSDIGPLPDDKSHNIVYEDGAGIGYFFLSHKKSH